MADCTVTFFCSASRRRPPVGLGAHQPDHELSFREDRPGSAAQTAEPISTPTCNRSRSSITTPRRSSDSSFRVAYDSQAIQTIYNKGFTNIFGSVVTLIGTFFIMLRLDWQLTLLSLGIVPLIVGAIYFFAHRIRTESTSLQEQESAVLVQTQEGLGAIRMVHAFGREDFEVSNFTNARREASRPICGLPITNGKARL